MITDKTLTDIIMICHGWYDRKVYKNELEAMNAYYKQYYHAGDIVLSKDFALHLFLRPLVIQAIEEKPFLARYLFQPVRNGEANKPFSEVMYDRSVALVRNLRKDDWDASRYKGIIKNHQEDDSDKGIEIIDKEGLSKDFAQHLFLRPLVLQAIEEKPFLVRYLFKPARNDEVNKPFSEVMYDRSIALVCNLRKDDWDASGYKEIIKNHQ